MSLLRLNLDCAIAHRIELAQITLKIGVISDIHGAIQELHNALDFLRVEQQVDEVICAGDLIDRYPDGPAVARLIRQQGIPCVRGNHDEYPFDYQFLDEETIEYCADLPDSLEFDRAGRMIFLCHANPWDTQQYVFPSASEDIFEQIMMISGADIVVLGHTHTPTIVNINDGACYVFNPGTLCEMCAYGPTTCGIITLPDDPTKPPQFATYDYAMGREVLVDEIEVHP